MRQQILNGCLILHASWHCIALGARLLVNVNVVLVSSSCSSSSSPLRVCPIPESQDYLEVFSSNIFCLSPMDNPLLARAARKASSLTACQPYYLGLYLCKLLQGQLLRCREEMQYVRNLNCDLSLNYNFMLEVILVLGSWNTFLYGFICYFLL